MRFLVLFGVMLSFSALANQYAYVQHISGSKPMRLFFIWTAGLFGYGKTSVPLGGKYKSEFFTCLEKSLQSLPNLTVEILLDDLTLKDGLSFLMSLKQRYPKRLWLSSMRHHLLKLDLEMLDHSLAHRFEEARLLNVLKEALGNAFFGNPALSSDIARLWWLHDPKFALNMYCDIDTFVTNVKKEKLHLLFPHKKHSEKVMRMDNKEDLQSNDIIATYQIDPHHFQQTRENFVKNQLMPEDYQTIWRSYLKKWEALQKDGEGFSLYQDSIKALIETMKKDFSSKAHRLTIMNKNKHRGLSLPVAMLRVTGTAADHGCSHFERQMYHGEKPSTQSWGSFAWTPCDTLMRDDRLAYLTSYLLDWNLFSSSGQKEFLKKLASEIQRLNQEVCLDSKKGTVCGIKLTHNEENDLDMDAYRHFEKALKEAQKYAP
jgi:hypothetical protein